MRTALTLPAAAELTPPVVPGEVFELMELLLS